jgi:hypothetical protein
MKPKSAAGGGLAGAIALTLIHEGLRRINPKAPRMDLLGMNALSNLIKGAGKEPPAKDKLYGWTMAGDVLSNSLYYSLTGVGHKKGALLRGGLIGLAAGAGAVLLPRPLGLNEAYSNRSTQTKLLTVGLYIAGGLVSAGVLRLLHKREEKRNKKLALAR